MLSGAAMKDAKAQLDQLGRRRNEVEAAIHQLEEERQGDELEAPEAVADRLRHRHVDERFPRP